MDNYIVSARKYRPMTFDSVVGQSALTTTLKKSIQIGHLAHAYLFCGPRGVGKTTCARIFAKTINCLSPKADGEACGECESCKAFIEQRSLNIYELDAASNNGVAEIQKLIEQTHIPPQIGKYKVFIIDEVHMLSNQAFNAFLKTLEEPPHYVIFILATTEKHKLLPTILSRCQIYDFNRMSAQDIVAHLQKVADKEGITAEPAALGVIAEKADGGMRDALSTFDQVTAFCGGNITYQQTIVNLNVLDYDYYFKLVDFFLEQKISDIIITFNDVLNKGFESNHFINGLNAHFRNLLMCRDQKTTQLLDVNDEIRQRYYLQSCKCKPQFLYSAIRKCTDCDINYKLSQNKRLLVEITLIEIAQVTQDDGSSSGRCPTKILKPIFNLAAGKDKVTAANTFVKPTVALAQSAKKTVINKDTARTVAGISLTKLDSELNAQTSKVIVKTNSESQVTVAEADLHVKLDLTQLTIAIKKYAHSLPLTKAAIRARLLRLAPTIVNDNTFEIIADNPAVEEQYKRLVPILAKYLTEELNMPQVNIQITMPAIDHKTTMTKAELYNKMKEKNYALAVLEKELKLHI